MSGLAARQASYSPSPLLDRYHDWLQRPFQGQRITALNRAYTEEDDTFLTVFPPFEQPSQAVVLRLLSVLPKA